jgi:phage baseplate assembly protein W
VLEPVLQRLIETSIGPALEVLVRREVERALKEQRPPE